MQFEHGLGAQISPPDQRDYQIAGAIPVSEVIFPREFIMPNKTGIEYYQGLTMECVAVAGMDLKVWQEFRNQKKIYDFSHDFLYVNRKIEQPSYFLLSFEGMYLRDMYQNLKDVGICRRDLFPDINDEWYEGLKYINRDVLLEASNFKIASYARCNNVNEIKAALMQPMPVGISIQVNSKLFGGYNSKLIHNDPDTTIYGNHMVNIYDWIVRDNVEYFVCKNWWKTTWGAMGGWFAIPTDSYINEAWATVDIIAQPKYWRIQCGAYRVKDNATRMSIYLKNKGFSTFIVIINGLYKVQVGAYSIEANADKERSKLIAAGITDAFKTYY